MSAGAHKTRRLVEDAIDLVISTYKRTGSLSGVTIYKGLSNGVKSEPRIEVVCSSAEYERVGVTVTGNSVVRATATLCSNARDVSRATHTAYAADLDDIFFYDDLAAKLNAVAVTDFGVFQAWPISGRDYVEGETLKTEIEIEIYCNVISDS